MRAMYVDSHSILLTALAHRTLFVLLSTNHTFLRTSQPYFFSPHNYGSFGRKIFLKWHERNVQLKQFCAFDVIVEANVEFSSRVTCILMDSNFVMPRKMMLCCHEVINVSKRTFKIHLP